jgi:dipeptidyl aminopeptidase/acylaminoacyl peptidase
MSTNRILSALVLMFYLVVAASAQQKKSFTPEASLDLQVLTFAPNGVSPDGIWIAYAVTDGYHQRSGTPLDWVPYGAKAHVWVRSLITPETLQVTAGDTFSWGPAWSPDGKNLAMYLWKDNAIAIGIWNREDHNLRVLPMKNLDGRLPLLWSPSGRFLVYSFPKFDLNGSVRRDAHPYDLDPSRLVSVTSSDQEPQPYDATLVDIMSYGLVALDEATGQTRPLLSPSSFLLTEFSFSPDGKYLAVVSAVRDSRWVVLYPPIHEVTVISWDDGSSKVVLQDTTAQSVTWTPDSRHLAYTDKDALWTVFVEGGEPKRISDARVKLAGKPLWDLSGKSSILQGGDDLYQIDLATGAAHDITGGLPGRKSEPVWAPDGKTLWFKTLDPETLAEGIAWVTISGSQPKQLIREDFAINHLAVTKRGELLYTTQTMSIPENLWAFDPSSGRKHQLTDTNAQIRNMTMGSARLLNWKSQDGQDLKGILLLPVGYQEGKKYPVIVWVYETFSSRLHYFKLHLYNLQVLANHGYAVLMPDVVFKTGQTAWSYVNSVVPALDRLQELGIANGRFGLMGHSFGGFATNILTTGTDRFQASIAIAGISDWVSFGSGPGDFMRQSNEKGQGHLGGPLWDIPERYIENSPVFQLGKVHTPMMIIHGTDDYRVPISQAEAMYYGLHRLGKTATLVAYPGEDHLYWETKRTVFLDMWDRILAWFEKYLKAENQNAP